MFKDNTNRLEFKSNVTVERDDIVFNGIVDICDSCSDATQRVRELAPPGLDAV